MRHPYLYAAILTLCLAGSVQAQTPVHTGFYIGPGAGLSFNKLSITNDGYNVQFNQISGVLVPGRGIVIVPGTTRPAPEGASGKTGVTGGIQLGYMKQSGHWVAGIEGDIYFLSAKAQADVDDSLPPTILQWNSPYGIHHTAAVHQVESIGAKVGYAVNRSFAYITLGVAFAGLKTTTADYYSSDTYWAQPWIDNMPHPTPAQDRFTEERVSETKSSVVGGFTFGIGYDWTFSPGYSLGVEYRHLKFSKSYTTAGTGVDTVAIDARPTYSGVLNGIPETATLRAGQVTLRLNISLDPLLKGKKKEKGNGKR